MDEEVGFCKKEVHFWRDMVEGENECIQTDEETSPMRSILV